MSATRVKLTIHLLIGALLCAGSDNTAAMEEVRYVHTDALGSPVAFSNESGEIVARAGYEPYGAGTDSGRSNRPGYGGHVSDGATALVYMQQRYYDPEIGGFLSVDPVTAYSGTQVAFARYRYANGNPYRFVDPDGRRSKSAKPEKVTGSNIPGNKSASAAMATGVPRPSSSVPAGGGSSPANTSRTLLEENVRATGAGRTRQLYREWTLDGVSEEGGYVVQEINTTGKYTMPGGTVTPFSINYWEAWRVDPGTTGPFPTFDEFTVGARESVSGNISWRGVARFYEGLTLPSSFTPGGAAEAGDLLSTYEDPKLDGRGASNAVIVNFGTSW